MFLLVHVFICLNFDKLVGVKLTIIIPTLNEDFLLGRLLDRLLTSGNRAVEIIVVDGGSEDRTAAVAESFDVQLFQCEASRAKQMNLGAQLAKGNMLYFVHADTVPPKSFFNDASDIFNSEFVAACYRSKFDSKKKIIHVNAFFTRFNWLVSRGGDQSLFIKKARFEELGGFDESMVIMEEYPLIEKLMEKKLMKVLPKTILISTRKYDNRSWLKVSRANYAAFKLYKQGADSSIIRKVYQEKLS